MIAVAIFMNVEAMNAAMVATREEEEKAPASEDKYWNQLSPEEQAAATALGYTKANWDEE